MISNTKSVVKWILLFNIIFAIMVIYFQNHTSPVAIVAMTCLGCADIIIGYRLVSEILSTPETPKRPFSEQSEFFFSTTEDTKRLNILVNNHQIQRTQIDFPTLDGIKSQVVDKDYVLIFTKDFRTIRLHKDEVQKFYFALIESDYSYFKPGIHTIELTVKTTDPQRPNPRNEA